MPRGTAQQGRTGKVEPCRKYMWTLHQLGCGMPFDAARPKKFDRQIVDPIKGSRVAQGFQNGISQFEKKN